MVKEGQGDQQGKQDQRAIQEAMAPQDHPVNGVYWDHRDLLDSPALRVHLDLPERTDCPDTLAREERLVSKVKPDLPDPQVLSDLRDQQARQDQWESEVTLDPQDHPVNRVYLDLRAKRERREIQVQQGQLVKTDLQDSEGSQAREVYQALWDQLA